MKNIAHFFVASILVISIILGAGSCGEDPPACTQLPSPEYLVISDMAPAADPELISYEWAPVAGVVDYTFSFVLSRGGMDTTIINNSVTPDEGFSINLPLSGVYPLMEDDLLTATVVANAADPQCSSAPRSDVTCISKTIVSVEEVYPITSPGPSTFCNTTSNCSKVRFEGNSFSDGTSINKAGGFYFYDRAAMCNCLSSNTLQFCMDTLEKCYHTVKDPTCP